jgi:hypothetical protein
MDDNIVVNSSQPISKYVEAKKLPKASFHESGTSPIPVSIIHYMIAMFNQANTAVALLCNHQKNANKSLDTSLDRIDERLKEYKKKNQLKINLEMQK